MNTINYSFTAVDTNDFFTSLGTTLEAEQEGGIINIPASQGTGFISRRTIGNDIVFLTWDIKLNSNIVFTKKPVANNQRNPSFILSYILNSENLAMNNSTGKKISIRGNRNILFMSADAELNFELQAGEQFRVINICVPLHWLKSELNEASPSFLHFLDTLGEKDHPTVFMESSPPAEYRVLADMNTRTVTDNRGYLSFKAKVFSLVADFFSRVFDHSAKEALDGRLLHHEKMLEVEAFLKKHLEMTLPDIATIARNQALSVSTLKRHFKMMFGKSIYEYYLELKMEHARELIVEKNLSVNEVANRLEYEKVSCFIDIFKKHHGRSPGTLRRKLV